MRRHFIVAIANTTQGRTQGVITERPYLTPDGGEYEPASSGVDMQLLEYFDDLQREGDDVKFIHLHSFSRNAPFGPRE